MIHVYAIRAPIAYMNYAKKLRIFNILYLFCVVYVKPGAVLDILDIGQKRLVEIFNVAYMAVPGLI